MVKSRDLCLCYCGVVQKLVILVVVPVLVLFCMTAFVSSFTLHDHPHRKVFVGSVGLVASASMYGSPLVSMVGPLFPLLTSLISINRDQLQYILSIEDKYEHDFNTI